VLLRISDFLKFVRLGLTDLLIAADYSKFVGQLITSGDDSIRRLTTVTETPVSDSGVLLGVINLASLLLKQLPSK
jgi:hypothetical protein